MMMSFSSSREIPGGCLDRLSQALSSPPTGATRRHAASRLMRRNAAHPQVAPANGRVGLGLGQRQDPVGNFVDGCLMTVAAVVCASQIAVLGDEQQTRHDVLHIDEVAGLLAVAKNRHLFSAHRTPQECRNSSRVGARRILSGPKTLKKRSAAVLRRPSRRNISHKYSPSSLVIA